MQPTPKIAFFGTPQIAVWVLEELKDLHITPELIVTNPDRPQGRGLELSPTPVKSWAKENDIAVFQPESLKDAGALAPIVSQEWDLFIVVAYGLILPKWFIELPKHGTINVHPSLLPKLRGASPIRTGLLQGMKDMGVTIMLMDERMDHGPILAQMPLSLPEPVLGRKADFTLAKMGGALLADTIPKWIKGDIIPKEQDHAQATYSTKIAKEMGELAIDPFALPTGKEAYEAYLKICAFDLWPGTYFFHKGKRIKITEASLNEGELQIHKVVPEGKKEIDFGQFLASAA